MKKCIEELQLKLRWLFLKLRYPKAGFYTMLVLNNGATMKEIDEWVNDAYQEGYKFYETIHEKREEVCAIEVSYWED